MSHIRRIETHPLDDCPPMETVLEEFANIHEIMQILSHRISALEASWRQKVGIYSE